MDVVQDVPKMCKRILEEREREDTWLGRTKKKKKEKTS